MLQCPKLSENGITLGQICLLLKILDKTRKRPNNYAPGHKEKYSVFNVRNVIIYYVLLLCISLKSTILDILNMNNSSQLQKLKLLINFWN